MEHGTTFFLELCEQAHIPMFVVQPRDAFRFVYINPAGCAHFQRSLNELLAMRIVDVDPGATEEGCVRFWHKLEIERRMVFRAQHRRKGGSVLPVEVTASLVDVGEDVYFMGHVNDLTERLAADEVREKLEAQRRQAQHMEGLVKMAGALAHEFNNLLVGVLANAGHVRTMTPAASPMHGALVDIEDSARLLADLCRELLAIAGRGRFAKERLDLATLLVSATESLRALVPTHATLHVVASGESFAIDGQGAQIRQILHNLVKNAVEALGERGARIVVSAGAAELTAEALRTMRTGATSEPGPHAFVEVADDGVGVDASLLDRVFEPFVTTHEGRRGLGLAAVQGIAIGHGGAVELHSDGAGTGTRVRVWFPSAVALPEEKPATLPPTSNRCVLVVDDEAGVRRAASRILSYAGYDVVTAEDGFEAVELVKRRPDIACVLLDLTMPRLDGRATLARIRELRQDLPVVITSGFDARDATSSEEDAFVGFLPKPFDPKSLTDAVDAVLSDERGAATDGGAPDGG